MGDLIERVQIAIRDIPDFPKAGILFKDITPVLASAELLTGVMDWMAEQTGPVDAVVGVEARGFIFGPPLAERLGVGFVMARKKGKLPYKTHEVEYALEYGTATLEVHVDAFKQGDRVVICDDLLATGGTAAAAIELVRRAGGDPVACCFLVELDFLDGRARLDVPCHSLVHY